MVKPSSLAGETVSSGEVSYLSLSFETAGPLLPGGRHARPEESKNRPREARGQKKSQQKLPPG